MVGLVGLWSGDKLNYCKASNSENLMGNLLKKMKEKQSIKKNYVPMGYLDLNRHRPL